jgi:hypothetical protein
MNGFEAFFAGVSMRSTVEVLMVLILIRNNDAGGNGIPHGKMKFS